MMEMIANTEILHMLGTILNILYAFSSVFSQIQSSLSLCNPMNRSMPGLPVHHQLPEFTQTHVHRVGDDISSFNSHNSSTRGC